MPSKTLSALFGVALVGVLIAGGLFAAVLGGLPLLLGYAAVTGLLLGLGIAKLRRLVAAAPPPPAAACQCCSPSSPGDHAAAVRVR